MVHVDYPSTGRQLRGVVAIDPIHPVEGLLDREPFDQDYVRVLGKNAPWAEVPPRASPLEVDPITEPGESRHGGSAIRLGSNGLGPLPMRSGKLVEEHLEKLALEGADLNYAFRRRQIRRHNGGGDLARLQHCIVHRLLPLRGHASGWRPRGGRWLLRR